MRRLAAVAAALTMSAIFAPVAARADTAADYNLFALHNLTVIGGSDTEGRVAVGNDAYLRGYSVGDKASPSDVNLVVGHNANLDNGSTTGKTIVVGTPTYGAGWSTAGLPAPGTPSPVDFTAEGTRLIALSDLLSTYAVTGQTLFDVNACSGHSCVTTLKGTSSGLNVFNIDASKLTATNTLKFDLAPGGTALVNVVGAGPGGLVKFYEAGMFINGASITASNQNLASGILWNFNDASSLDFYSVGFAGSILAPTADYVGGWGVIHGQVIVDDFSGSGSGHGITQVNNVRYTGGLLTPPPSVAPEPASWVLMILGVGGAGAMIRRRRAMLAA